MLGHNYDFRPCLAVSVLAVHKMKLVIASSKLLMATPALVSSDLCDVCDPATTGTVVARKKN